MSRIDCTPGNACCVSVTTVLTIHYYVPEKKYVIYIANSNFVNTSAVLMRIFCFELYSTDLLGIFVELLGNIFYPSDMSILFYKISSYVPFSQALLTTDLMSRVTLNVQAVFSNHK